MIYKPFRHFSGRCPRAFTLIEVVAALAILGTAATAILVTQTQAIHQLGQAKRLQTAHVLAERLVTHWQLSNQPIERSASGSFEDQLGWSWRRTVRRARFDNSVEMLRIVLSISHVDSGGVSEEVFSVEWLAPLPTPSVTNANASS